MMLRQRYIYGGTRLPPICIMLQTKPGRLVCNSTEPWVKNLVQGVQYPVYDAATAGDPGPTYQSV